ncbi:MAG TPA: hypothetical protein VGE43_17680 [Acidimicrobiales bacterium]
MTETTTSAAGRRRPVLLAAAAVAAAVLVGGVALVATGGDDDPPRLDLNASAPAPAASGGGERVAESADAATDDMAGMSMMAWARYVAADELPDLGGSAPVYRLVADDDDLRALAEHFGIEGDVTDADGQQRMISAGEASVSRYGASWWYTSGQTQPGSDVAVSSGCAAGPDAVCEEPAPMPEPERPADLPSQAEAEAIVRDIAEAAGLDLTGARITAYDNITTWSVSIELALDGTPIPGWSVYGTVTAGGLVLDAGGALGSLEDVGDYPLDTTRVAIDRLNEQSSGQGSPEPAIEPDVQTDPAAGGGTTGSAGSDPGVPTDTATTDVAEPAPGEVSIMPVEEGDGEPLTVTLRSGELSYTLVGNVDGTETYLVPAYLLDGEDDRGEPWLDVFAIAVRAEFLAA